MNATEVKKISGARHLSVSGACDLALLGTDGLTVLSAVSVVGLGDAGVGLLPRAPLAGPAGAGR